MFKGGSALSETWNNLFIGFGQFITHDILHTPIHRDENGKQFKCCDSDVSEEIKALKCSNFDWPENDHVMRQKGNISCFNQQRSMRSISLDCGLSRSLQLDQTTQWLDLSNIYEAKKERHTKKLRTFRGGLLKMTDIGRKGKPILPLKDGIEKRKKPISADKSRFTVNPILVVLSTVFSREHNRIATELGKMRPRWNDEKLYQEARRINIAQYQHVVYKEFVPELLGEELINHMGISCG